MLHHHHHPVVKDRDTVKRSVGIVRDDTRLYSKRVSEEEDDVAESHAIGLKSKFSVMVGVRYYDLQENTKHFIHSIFEQVNDRAKSIPHYRVSAVEDDAIEGKEVVCHDR